MNIKKNKKPFFLFCLFCQLFAHMYSQDGCNPGYENRKVKCGGQITEKCVPENYNCNKCWILEFESKNKDGWFPLNYFPSYESADERRREIQQGKPSIYNYNISRIYIDDNKFCSNSISDSVAVINDFISKIKPFINRYRAEIKNFKRQYKGQSYKPGAVFKEYQTLLDQSEAKVNKLDNQLSYITNGNMSEIENSFKDLQAEELELSKATQSLVAVQNQTKNIEPEKELTDDEKLNQAMMKQLEKNFDANQKANKNELVIIDKVNNSNQYKNTNKVSNSSTNKLNINSSEDKIIRYKEFIVSSLNNYKFEVTKTSNFGSVIEKTTIKNCYWTGNKFNYTVDFYVKNPLSDPINDNRNNFITNIKDIDEKIYDMETYYFYNNNFRSYNKDFLQKLKEAFEYIYSNSK